MTNISATYAYRREVAQAISRYRAAQREIFERYGRPVPLSQDAGSAMCEAWGDCRVALAMADQRLDGWRAVNVA